MTIPSLRLKLALVLPLLTLAVSAAGAQQTSATPAGCTHPNGRVCARCDRDDLWIVTERCLQGKGGCFRPEDSSRGYVVVKDISPMKPMAFLLMPANQVSGVEDPKIFEEPVLDFWQYAFDESKTHPGAQPNHSMAAAINAECARSEGQLHIHISCAHASVVRTLKLQDSKIGFAAPTSETFPGMRSQYEVIKVRSLTGDNSPFKVIRKFLTRPEDMQDQGIAVIPSEKPGEFYVLSTTYGAQGGGGAEELLDQHCSE
jgi:CDP-diacylglycerol pyrophosphatase